MVVPCWAGLFLQLFGLFYKVTLESDVSEDL